MEEVLGRGGEGIAVEDDEVGEVAGFEAALAVCSRNSAKAEAWV